MIMDGNKQKSLPDIYDWNMAQEAEYLPDKDKHEALSSNPMTTKIKQVKTPSNNAA
jgi:hypothetical protein